MRGDLARAGDRNENYHRAPVKEKPAEMHLGLALLKEANAARRFASHQDDMMFG